MEAIEPTIEERSENLEGNSGKEKDIKDNIHKIKVKMANWYGVKAEIRDEPGPGMYFYADDIMKVISQFNKRKTIRRGKIYFKSRLPNIEVLSDEMSKKLERIIQEDKNISLSNARKRGYFIKREVECY